MMAPRTPPRRLLLLLLLVLLLGIAVSAHARAEHDHVHGRSDDGHAHQSDHDGAAGKKVAVESAERRAPPPAEHAAPHNQHRDHGGHARDGANTHDHDHDGHDDHDGHRALKGSAAHAAHDHDDHAHNQDHHGHAHHGHAHAHHGSRTPSPALAAGTKTVAAATATIDRFSVWVWSEALFATALVGAAPVLVLLFVPLGVGNQEAQKPLLRVFLSFAAGGLLGDALLHLLPHSIPHGHNHGHDDHDHDHDDHNHGHSHSVQDLSVWLWTIAGMMTFLLLEKFVRAQTGGHGHSHSGGGNHGHAHSHGDHAHDGAKRADAATTTRKRKTNKDGDVALADDAACTDYIADDPNKQTQQQPIAAAGYLNLAADFAHNFTDGLAIGATFLRGSGWSTTVAMLLHELPHEIGDFAILIQSGFTRREAMLTQLLTALGAMVGTVLGLLMEGAGESNSAWISPFTAGGFIYIACASVMPELLEDCSLWQSLKEAAAMAVGVGLMVLIALSE